MLEDDGPGGVDTASFLRDYWQKKPLLIRRAMPDFHDFLSPEELAGLACEDGVESRLVQHSGTGWRVKHGPFSERDFTFLGEDRWTLLVQSVDHWLPALKSLLREMAFLPAWRLDDIMVSYAAVDGGVGPHFDYYDVFLLQGAGTRRWRIGQQCDSSTPLDTRSGLKIMPHFEEQESVELRCGDMLYIPPGRAHHGIALEAGLSYSIGFRAPGLGEIMTGFSQHLSESLSEDLRYRDPPLDPEADAGEIGTAALHQLKGLVTRACQDESALLDWFGRFMTEPRIPELFDPPETGVTPEQLATALQKGLHLARHPLARFAWHQSGNQLRIFADGTCFPFAEPGKMLMGMNRELQGNGDGTLDLKTYQRNEQCLILLAALINQGTLVRAHDNKPAQDDD